MYKATNEHMHAIKKGVVPTSQDCIYSVAGSFDAPFMFLETGARVTAVDLSVKQLTFGTERIGDLNKGNLVGFIGAKNSSSGDFFENGLVRNDYFTRMNYETLKNNLVNLDYYVGDFVNFETNLARLGGVAIENEIDYSRFNKVYMSNVFDHYLDKPEFRTIDAINNELNYFFEKFSSGTLFYMVAKYINYYFDTSEIVLEDKEKSIELSSLENSWNIHILTRI